jgi:argininosuccinate lyase
MHTRRRILDVREALANLRQALLDRAEGHEEAVMPGYTHTQHAQPISVAFWLTGHAAGLARDDARLADTYRRVNTCPLGAAALAGTSFPTDRNLTATLLGFDAVQEHSLDCVGTRDFVAEVIADLAILMAALSKIAEEFVIWSSYEYRMLEMDDAYSSGSSIMPQKKNPCIAELTRGKVGIVYGRLMQILTMLKALPSGYNRDLQEDKPPLWEAFDCTELCLQAVTEMVKTFTPNLQRMRELVGRNFATATELANFLVRERGLPFRTCHEIVGNLVGTLVREGRNLEDHGRVQEILALHGQTLSREEIADIVDPVRCLQRQVSLGSTGPESVRKMLASLSEGVKTSRLEIAAARDRIEEAYAQTMRIVEEVLA